VKIRINPANGRLETKDSATITPGPANNINEVQRTCDSSANVNDLVYNDPINANKVLVNTDNIVVWPTIGIIKSKSNPTTCIVLLYGPITGQVGLTKDKYLFLGIDGKFTAVPPTTDYVQILGTATSSTTAYFWPQINRMQRA
jgi:hypothetical protein